MTDGWRGRLPQQRQPSGMRCCESQKKKKKKKKSRTAPPSSCHGAQLTRYALVTHVATTDHGLKVSFLSSFFFFLFIGPGSTPTSELVRLLTCRTLLGPSDLDSIPPSSSALCGIVSYAILKDCYVRPYIKRPRSPVSDTSLSHVSDPPRPV